MPAPQAAASAQMASAQTASAQMASAHVATTPIPSYAPLSVGRRQPIALNLSLAAAGGGSAEPALDFDSSLDMPAFLRRQN